MRRLVRYSVPADEEMAKGALPGNLFRECSESDVRAGDV